MSELQATTPEKIKTARKRRTSRIAGWLVLFLCAQVGLNVAKQHIRESFKAFANIVTAQPQELPRKPRIEFGPDKAQERKYVRLPTLGANYMRAGGKTYTLPPRNTQGYLARNTVFKAPDKPTRKVSRRADNLDRARHLARKKAELITPSARPPVSGSPTRRCAISTANLLKINSS